MTQKIRFGIIGCSKIANRSTIPAMKNSNFAELKMISSRSNEKAKKFARFFGCENFGTYNDVIQSEEIDAVYISLPIGLHEEWSIKASEAGKHVLCEKSSTTSYSSAKLMIESSKKNNVRIMEGFMFKFHPQHKKVLEFINSNKIGKPFVFCGSYGFPHVSKGDIRYNPELGGGVLNETGCYPIYSSRIIFQSEPIGVLCNLYKDEKVGVDTKGHAYILYKEGKTAFVAFGFENFYQANYRIWGSKGIIELDRAYAVPPDFSPTIKIQNDEMNEKTNVKPVDHFKIMINEFCTKLNDPSDSSKWEEDLLNQARLMEALRVSSNEKRFVNLSEI